MPYEEEFLDEGKTSKISAGPLKMQRIHALQERIQNSRMNPLAFSEQFGVFNYQVIFNSTNALYQEVCPKLTNKEKIQGTQIRIAIKNIMKRNPVHENKLNQVGGRKVIKFDSVSWEIIDEALYRYETLILEFLEKHGMSLPDEEKESLEDERLYNK